MEAHSRLQEGCRKSTLLSEGHSLGTCDLSKGHIIATFESVDFHLADKISIATTLFS